MSTADAARRRRRAASARYRPARIDTLLVSEASPSALDRYFYLDELRERGWFLVHMSVDPFHDRSVLPPLLPDLLARCDVRLPYPGSGQQRRFLEGFRSVGG